MGASEQAVRELFVKARQVAPCVIFIDEIDTVAPARGSHVGDSGVGESCPETPTLSFACSATTWVGALGHDLVVGQLLAELDGIKASGNILLIGATNRPEVWTPPC